MVEYSTDTAEVGQVYADLAEDVAVREERLREELPIDTTAEIHTHLRSVGNDWETGRKSLRTVPVCTAYAHELDRPVGEPLKRLLTGLDASVNVLDDMNVLAAVTDLYRHFSHSEDGNKRYGEPLHDLERVPDELHSLLSEAKDHVDSDRGL